MLRALVTVDVMDRAMTNMKVRLKKSALTEVILKSVPKKTRRTGKNAAAHGLTQL